MEFELPKFTTVRHLPVTLVHPANVATRTEQVFDFDPSKEEITSGRQANAMIRRRYEPGDWAIPNRLTHAGA